MFRRLRCRRVPDVRVGCLPHLPGGMVFTVEPKIYVPQSNIAIMIEDVILVTEDGYENLSAGAPKEVEEIERIMAGGGPRDLPSEL